MKGRAIVVRLAEIMRSVAAEEMSPKQLSASLREMAQWVEESGKAEGDEGAAAKRERPTATIEVFDYWVDKTRRSPKLVKLTPERRRAIEARLRTFSVADIKGAIDYVAKSTWHQGENDAGKRYDDIITICRNDTRLETYRNAGRTEEMPGSGRRASGGEGGLQQLLTLSKEALKRGDDNAYRDAQSRISALRRSGGDEEHPGESE